MSCNISAEVARLDPRPAGAGNREDDGAPAVAMTVDSVDAALEEVRPYLIADGGNVTVAAVEGGVVMLQLEARRSTRPPPPASAAVLRR